MRPTVAVFAVLAAVGACGGSVSLGTTDHGGTPDGSAGDSGAAGDGAASGRDGALDFPDPPSVVGATTTTCGDAAGAVEPDANAPESPGQTGCAGEVRPCVYSGASCENQELLCAWIATCCISTWTAGASFGMGRGQLNEQGDATVQGCNDDELPEHAVTLSSFFMNDFEVTTGRFQVFVDAGMGTTTSPPEVGSGAPPAHPEAGWQEAWASHLALTTDALAAIATAQGSQSSGGNRAMKSVTFYEAFAFCVWDGGRLPTEAEWEFAAASAQNRRFPWGNTDPFQLGYTPNEAEDVDRSGLTASLDGQYDLAGSVAEWTLDAYGPYSADACTNPLTTGVDGADRSVRGGSYASTAGEMRAAARAHEPPDARHPWLGFRCVRDQQ